MNQENDPAQTPQSQQGVSLEQLSQLYAQTLKSHPGRRDAQSDAESATPAEPDSERRDTSDRADRQADARGAPSHGGLPAEPPTQPPSETRSLHSPGETGDAPSAETCPITPESILEAMLFVGDRENAPLPAAKAAMVMRGVEPEEIPELVSTLNRRYAARGCPYRIVSREGGYCLILHPRFENVRSRFYGRIREARLSQAAIDVLSIVAYRQPITAEEVSRLRGTPSGHLLSGLVQRRLLQGETPPGKRRPVKYRTTQRFLELFGLDRVEDLPETEDIDKR